MVGLGRIFHLCGNAHNTYYVKTNAYLDSTVCLETSLHQYWHDNHYEPICLDASWDLGATSRHWCST